MEYAIGAGLALGVGVFGTVSGFDRDRAFYPTALVVIAALYDLFAIIGGGESALGVESGVLALFVTMAVIGFRTNLWIVAGALVAHGLFDLVHGQLIENAGVPAYWPMFCMTYDVVAGGYLGLLLGTGRLSAKAQPGFGARIRPHVDVELAAATAAELASDPAGSFRHLERAHVLGQASTIEHVRVHARMLGWAIRQRNASEIAGQLQRVIGAAAVTPLGIIPKGNTGGSNVGPFKSMPIPDDLAKIIASARKTAGTLVSVALLIGTLAVSACSTTRNDTPIPPAQNYEIAYKVYGSGKPVVVMISGLGFGMATFERVAPEIAKSATVIIYDRSGYGGSGVAQTPRDAAGAEQELSRLLKQTGIRGPYVLVGHSLGGLFAEYYAVKHPDQIAGLILEESRPADFGRRCEAAGISMCTPLPSMTKGMPKGAQDEVAALRATQTEVEAAGQVKGKPVLVFSRPVLGNANPFAAMWSVAQVDLAARYPGSLHRVATAGGHDVHNDQQAWYVTQVSEFLSQLN